MTERTFDIAPGPDEHGQWGTINGQPITDDTIARLDAVRRCAQMSTPAPPASCAAHSMSTWPTDG